MSMTPIQKRLFKESIIREFKEKHEDKIKRSSLHYKFIARFKKIMPLNIALGVTASVILIYLKGWYDFTILLLTGIIWITLISTVVSAFFKHN